MQITTPLVKKMLLFLFLVFVFGIFALGCASPPASISTPTTQTSTPTELAETEIATSESTATQPITEPTVSVSAPPGLKVVYLRDGNLWSWTEVGGNVLLMNTGNLSSVRLSQDGQLLAFLHGSEIWTVHMDGKDARLLAAQKEPGCGLSFAPNRLFLAVSAADHIDVIDLNNATITTVATYPALPSGYYPEAVWSADSTGLKTVVPSNSDKGKAEFLFIFINGTKASLAKFSMVPFTESRPFISPDGGYIIYVTSRSDGKESLNLMDSSGATRPYGEPAVKIRVYGWLPTSKHFIYAIENENKTMLGDVTGMPPMELVLEKYDTLYWLSAEHFLAIQDGKLFLGDINGGKSLIAEGVSDFDFAT
jgi:hypothetical protein